MSEQCDRGLARHTGLDKHSDVTHDVLRDANAQHRHVVRKLGKWSALASEVEHSGLERLFVCRFRHLRRSLAALEQLH